MTGKTASVQRFHATPKRQPREARDIIMEIERALGFEPKDREFDQLGYDIESRIPRTGKLRFIEVKGRVSGAGADHRHEERNPLFAEQAGGLHPRHRGVLPGDHTQAPLRPTSPFEREPDFGVTSVNYDFAELLARPRSHRENLESPDSLHLARTSDIQRTQASMNTLHPLVTWFLAATWLFGVMPAVTARGVRVLDEWLDVQLRSQGLRLLIVVYPACAARQSDLADLEAIARRHPIVSLPVSSPWNESQIALSMRSASPHRI